MSPWEFAACVEGYNKAHGENKPAYPTDEEYEEAMRVARPTLETIH
jgi:hypothetical protein